MVVGDNRGAVTVYRILDPITITHEGPVQQTTKLKQVLLIPLPLLHFLFLFLFTADFRTKYCRGCFLFCDVE